VEAGTPRLNTESATVSTMIDQTFVQNLPLNGRSFQTLIMLTPGVVIIATAYDDQGQFSVNGQRADANSLSTESPPTSASPATQHSSRPPGERCPRSPLWVGPTALYGVRTHSRRTNFHCDALGNE